MRWAVPKRVWVQATPSAAQLALPTAVWLAPYRRSQLSRMLREPRGLTVQSLLEWIAMIGTGRCSSGRRCSARMASTTAETGLKVPGLAQTKPTEEEVSE